MKIQGVTLEPKHIGRMVVNNLIKSIGVASDNNGKGEIISWNERYVFVKYPDTKTAIASSPDNLEFIDEYSRTHLISICERAIVNINEWESISTRTAQDQLAIAWMLLKAGCEFEILTEENSNIDIAHTNDKIIWISIKSYTSETLKSKLRGVDEIMPRKTFYLPTEKRLYDREGKDWMI